MSEKETVEKLAEDIDMEKLGTNLYYARSIGRCMELVSDFLRSHGIDPATMKPIRPPWPLARNADDLALDVLAIASECDVDTARRRIAHRLKWLFEDREAKQQPPIAPPTPVFVDTTSRYEPKPDVEQLQKSMDEYRAGNARPVQEVIDELQSPTAPQPEVVVSERDVALAMKLLAKPSQDYPNIIANHMAAERAEHELANRRGEELCGLLIEAQAKLKEAEERVKELECVMGLTMRRAASIANDAETYLKSPPSNAE